MDWMQSIDIYCERLGPEFWAEPLNALTNAMFIIAAFVAWRIKGDKRDRGATFLIIMLAVIGVGSFLWHTFALRWAMFGDIIPILIFIEAFIFVSCRKVLGVSKLVAWVTVALYVPASFVFAKAVTAIAGDFNGTVFYFPTILFILFLAFRTMGTATGKGMVAVAVLLATALTFRSVDLMICESFPYGTHFLWHSINGVMMGLLIVVLLRHKQN